MNMAPSHRSFAPDMGREVAKELPSNVYVEADLLGALLMTDRAFEELPRGFGRDMFFEQFHADIFSAIETVIHGGKKPNPINVLNFLPREIRIGEEETPVSAYLSRLVTKTMGITMVKQNARTLMMLAVGRDFIGFSDQMQDIGFSCIEELSFMTKIGEFQDRFDEVVRRANGEESRRRTLAEAAETAIGSTADAMSGNGVTGVDHGFAPLMSLIGPLVPGHLIVIGGATKQGKSSLIEQIMAGAASNGHPVWVYSGEMTGDELAGRALSRVTEIQAWRQVQGKVSETELDKLYSAQRDAKRWMSNIHIEDKSMTLTQINREIERFSKKYPNSMAVVDHIGLIERDKNSARMSEQEFGPMATQALKMTARRAGVPLVAAAQLKKNTLVQEDRKVTESTFMQAMSRRPKYTDLIGACEKDANHVIIPFRAEPILQELEPVEGSDLHATWENKMDQVRGKAEIRLAISRHRTWPQRREVRWNGGKTMFEPQTDNDQGRFL